MEAREKKRDVSFFLRNFRRFFVLYQADAENHESTRIHTNGIGPEPMDNGTLGSVIIRVH